MQDSVDATYGSSRLAESLLRDLQARGCDLSRLTTEDLLPYDELHLMGRQATLALGRKAGIMAGMHVLDLGSGLGGPARTLAQTLGCRVTGIDLSDEFVQTSMELTRRVGLAQQVDFRRADALHLPFEAEQFDAVFMIHLNMNISDKAALFTEARRVVKTGGRLALWEVCRGDAPDFLFPVPWADDAAFSFLVPMDALTGHINATGFKKLDPCDATDEAVAWVRERQAAVHKPKAQTVLPPALDLIFKDFRRKRINISKNLLNGSIRLLRAVAVK